VPIQIILILVGSMAAGALGSLTGLGGGVVVIPMLVLGFGIDLRYAIGASLVAVIATSSGSAAAFVRDGFTNVRVAILLEVATTSGALGGAVIATLVDKPVIATVFSLVLFYSAWKSATEPKPHAIDTTPDPLATRLGLHSTMPAPGGGRQAYLVHRVPHAFGVMLFAGVLSALVGVGSGVVKVIALDRLMRLPFKVSTTTSNFMIGVTAAASAGVYLHRGQIVPSLCAPVAIGALAGSLVGGRLLVRAKTRSLRITFAIVVALAGVQLLLRTITGGL
jgi:uncharacterized membrane protein YfcA